MGLSHFSRWKLSDKRIAYSHIDKSRGQKVVEDALGKDYGGLLISDFLSAYNKINTKGKQRCLVHLFRDLKKVVEYWHDDKEVLRYCKRLKDMLDGAITLYKEYLKRMLKRFANRLDRHKDEILTLQ